MSPVSARRGAARQCAGSEGPFPQGVRRPRGCTGGGSGTTVEAAAPADVGVYLLAANLLREASRELRLLRLVRGASRRTARRAARATAVLIAAGVLLGAGPLARPVQAADPHFVGGIPFGLSLVRSRANPALADLDGDGDLDAVVGAGHGETLFFRNTGTAQSPAFAAPRTNPFGLTDVDSSSPALADIDGDGDLDALIGEARGDTFLFRNTGSATSPAFAAPLTNPFGLRGVGSASHPAFADLDGDGDLDAVIGAGDGSTIFFENTGSAQAPAFAAPIEIVDVGDNGAPTFADLDGDGDLDRLIGERNGDLLFFRNTGSAQVPAFADPLTNPFGLGAVGEYPSPAFADVDDDGDLDVFVGALDGNTIFFRNTGSATAPAFEAPLGLAFLDADTRLAFVDIDGDGDLDAFAGQGTATLFFRNTGSAVIPAFAASVTNPFGLTDAASSDSSPALADIDGDGDFDAFVTDRTHDTLFFRNIGSARAPAFAAPLTNPFGLADVGERSTPAFADIDGDGDLDAVVGEYHGNTFLLRNIGSARAPAFGPPVELVDVGFYSSPALADVDGDGDLDAFVGEFDGDTFFFRNTGSAVAPAFAAAPATNPFGLVNVGPYASPAFADIDADGDLDAFLAGGHDGRTFFFENRPPCPGDCDASGQVGISELIRGVNIALGNLDLSICAAIDSNANEAVTIDELIAAVNAALSGCPP
jgi:hypothetical protein